jgi:4-amino-4-deoxy-L-arabinose transferase-like glycosyltransferase
VSKRAYLIGFLVIVSVAMLTRTLWLRADPPTVHAVGVVWHDEGPWTHSARNRVLWGTWRTDNWNPVFVAPVFTAFEYASFRGFGVGTWQARVVPVVSGVLAVVFLMLGLYAIAGRSASLIGGSLLATDYVFVMWNRAALMESTMTAFMVIAWTGYALAQRRAAWGVVAGAAAVLAFFTKAAAAFFVGAIVLEALFVLMQAWLAQRKPERAAGEPTAQVSRAAVCTLIGTVAAAALVIGAFVLPNWSEYQFYNWQMSVVRKPSYAIGNFVDRASWLPVVQSFFTRMWPVFLGAMVSMIVVVTRWRTVPPAARLLVWWMLLGFLELIVHDAGNERRYVMFIPAIIALAVLFAGRRADLQVRQEVRGAPDLKVRPTYVRPTDALFLFPLLLFLAYLTIGSALQPLFRDAISQGHYRVIVRISAVAALLVTGWALSRPGRVGALTRPWSQSAMLTTLGLMLVWNGFQYVSWAARRTDLNYQASRAIGALLPPGTLVQGKLANGLALENRIRPIFVGRGFGNYEDRLRRDDVRYILTYVLPTLGYESQAGLIQEILDHYPRQRVLATFDVDETIAVDRAALFDKFY